MEQKSKTQMGIGGERAKLVENGETQVRKRARKGYIFGD